ncbi:MAG TPA: ACT domain-containing protein [Elusimicrobiota bacterium]|nr:ACT domain-containing protein [Elusimicrobiota bacterium]HMX43537.1 ACT domain-containing protein [Elusimicrobiota bacterium]HMX94378.1 ACT domain-containing protein [Elusimicrobiota bacterium]HMZ26625.1 ACT domain-containing protein [Elusimicrobiota bacterium]HNC74007.1 ACT domain-containing protein [Elusimicrobiota bacterium]
MKRYLLTAAGGDRPGLVAAVTRSLFDHGCNLEDSAMTRLQGEFAILLIFSGPPSTAPLEKTLKRLGKKTGLVTHVKSLSGRETRSPRRAAEGVLVSVYGADRPGIVFHVTDRLARAKVNITDLSTHRTSAGKSAGYILYIEAELPRGLSPEALQSTLRDGAAAWGVTVQVKPLAASAL